MSYKQSSYSTEEKIKLAGETSKDRLYEPKLKSRKKLRILTVIAYIFCVSLAAIMLSLYYVFLWDPSGNTIKPLAVTCVNNCEKIVIPENLAHLAIRLSNSTEVSADTFFHNFYKRLRLIQVTEIPNMKKIRIKEISMRPHKKLKSMRKHHRHRQPNPNLVINETVDDKDSSAGDEDVVTKSYENFDLMVEKANEKLLMDNSPSEMPNQDDDEADSNDYEQSGNGGNTYQLRAVNDTTSVVEYDDAD